MWSTITRSGQLLPSMRLVRQTASSALALLGEAADAGTRREEDRGSLRRFCAIYRSRRDTGAAGLADCCVHRRDRFYRVPGRVDRHAEGGNAGVLEDGDEPA